MPETATPHPPKLQSQSDRAPTPGSVAEFLSTSDEHKRAGLRRMKALATGMFLVAALIYVATVVAAGMSAQGWVGYVQAAAEAGMVGALADWFAVTALFKHPLGLPIPHTAIIPTRKDQMGVGLGEFVGTHFLADAVIREKVASVSVARRAGSWLSQEHNAARVGGELGRALRGLLAVLDDEEMKTTISRVLADRVERFEVSPALGYLLNAVVADGAHTGVVDVLADRAHVWVAHNRPAIADIIIEQSPTWTPRFVDELIADRTHQEAMKFTAAIRDDPEHPVRKSIDRLLTQFANDLRDNPTTRERVERAKNELFYQPDVQHSVSRVWETARRLVLEAADDPESELRVRFTATIQTLGHSLETDAGLQANLDSWVEDTVANLVASYKGDLTAVISDTVSRWDGPQTAQKIELAVGHDLQFIRINGTVVGALAGLVIHALSVMLH